MAIERYPLYPFIMGLLPVLFLFVHNQEQVGIGEVLLPSLVILVVVAVILFITFVFCRDAALSGALTAVFVLTLFWYGAATAAMDAVLAVAIRARYALPAALLLASSAVLLLTRRRDAVAAVTRPLNVFSLAMLGLLSLLAVIGGGTPQPIQAEQESSGDGSEWRGSRAPALKPDIYFVILDGYARADVLRDYFSYDNSAFTRALERRGFHVIPDSRSNYALTFLSLASSLNVTHLTHLEDSLGASKDRTLPYQMISNNKVMRFLRALGYRTVSFNSGWGATRSLQVADVNVRCGWSSEFIEAVLRQTAAWPVLRRVTSSDLHDMRLCQLDQLVQMRHAPGPKFVFAHLLLPHPPFLFAADGERLPGDAGSLGESGSWAKRDQYVEQLRFVNTRVLALVDSLVSGPNTPIIVLQSDHGSAASGGPWSAENSQLIRERMPILNALLLPQFERSAKDDFLTPVNTFSLILNSYFGTSLPLAPNASYLSSYDAPYQFVLVDSHFGHAEVHP